MDEFHTSDVDSGDDVKPSYSKSSKASKRSKFSHNSADTPAEAASEVAVPEEASALPEAAEPVVEPEVVEAEVAVTEPAAAKAEPPVNTGAGLTATEWLALCRVQLGVKPWILRAAVVDENSARKYTEAEIRSLIQRKLSEPA